MRVPTIFAAWAIAGVTWTVPAAANAWPANAVIERRSLDGAGRLVVSGGVSAPVAVVCRVEQRPGTGDDATSRGEWALDVARRGGTETEEDLFEHRAWCASVPFSELGFALWLAARRGALGPRAPLNTEASSEASPSLIHRLQAIALAGGSKEPPLPSFVVSVVASGPTTEIVALAQRHFRVGLPDPAVVVKVAPPRQSNERLAVIAAEVPLPIVHSGWVVPDDGPGTSAALAIALDVVGAERLQKTVVARAMARRIETWARAAPGVHLVGLSIEPGARTSIDRVRRFVDGTWKQLRLVGPSAREISRAARRLELAAATEWEHPLSRARELAWHELSRGDTHRWLADVAALSRVAPEDVRRVAHDRLLDMRRTTVEAYPPLWPADDPDIREHGLHTVARGETLSGLAARFGVGVAAIARANDLDPNRVLSPGQGLWIPPAGSKDQAARSAPSSPSRR